MTGTPETFKR